MWQRTGEHNDDVCDITGPGSYLQERTRIAVSGMINEYMSYNGRFENTQNLRTNRSTNDVNYNLAWVQANKGTNIIKLGRFEYKPVYGLVADSTMKGLAITGGKNFTYGLYIGKPDIYATNNELRNVWFFNEPSMIAVEIGTKLGNNANLKAGYYDIKHSYNTTPNRHLSIFEIGGDIKFNDFKLTAAYAKSNIPADKYTDPEARNKPGSYGLNKLSGKR